VEDAFTGAVTVVQRFDSALRLNVHFHTLLLDGVYVQSENGEGLRFLRLLRPSEDDVYEVAMRKYPTRKYPTQVGGRQASDLTSAD
jgi:Putative transposase